MLARDFIRFLSEKKALAKDVLEKVTDKISQSPKEPTAEALMVYLVKKKLVTTQVGEKLLTEFLNSQAKGPAKGQAKGPAKDRAQDSDALLQSELLNPTKPAEVVGPHDRTVVDDGQFVSDPTEFAEPVVTPEVDYGSPQPTEEEPYAAGLDAAGLETSEQGGEASSNISSAFAGKRVKGNPWQGAWLWVGGGLMLVFSALAVGLLVYFNTLSANQLWDKADESYKTGGYTDAKAKFTDFRKRFPKETRASLAFVRLTMCDLLMATRSDPESVLEYALTLLPTIEKEEGFSDARDELADILPNTVVALAKKAQVASNVSKKKELHEKALQALALVDNPMYITTADKAGVIVSKKISEGKELIGQVERQLNTDSAKMGALSKINEFVTAGQTNSAFETYRGLVMSYPELEASPDVRDVRQLVAKREQTLVTSSELSLAPEAAPADPAAVLFATYSGEPLNISDSQIIPVVTNGALYAIRAADGQALWRKFVGFQYDGVVPQPVPDASPEQWIVASGHDNSILCVDALSGNVVWRVPMADPFFKPVATTDYLYVSTANGKVLKLDIRTGRGIRQAQLPQSVTSAVGVSGTGQYLYQAGNQWYLYVLDAEQMTCKEVFLLNHDAGTIVNPPSVQRGLIYVAESKPQNSSVHILATLQRGWSLERPQPKLNFAGRLTNPLLSYGRDDLIVSDDLGNVAVLSAIGDEGERPVVQGINTKFQPTEGINSRTMMAKGGHFYVTGMGISRFALKKQLQSFESVIAANPTDTFLGTPQVAEESLFHVRRQRGAAVSTLSAVEMESLKSKWQVDLGAALAGVPFMVDGKAYVVTSQGDQYEFEPDGKPAAYKNALRRGSTTGQMFQYTNTMATESGLGFVASPNNRRERMVFNLKAETENARSRPSTWPDDSLPLACQPVLFGDSVIACASSGEVFLVNLKSGSRAASGFRPALSPGQTVEWHPPVALSAETLVAVTGKGELYRLDVVRGGLSKGSEAAWKDTAVLRPPVRLQEGVAVVRRQKPDADSEGNASRDQLVLIGADLAEQRSLDLPELVRNGPWVSSDGQLLVETTSGNWVVINPDFTVAATIASTPFGEITGEPVAADGRWMIATKNGYVVWVAGSEVQQQVALRQNLLAGPVRLGEHWVVTTADGALLYVPTEQAGE